MSGSAQLISGVSANNGAHVVAGTVHGSVYIGDNESECSSGLVLHLLNLVKANWLLMG
jgi:hypothetical protein